MERTSKPEKGPQVRVAELYAGSCTLSSIAETKMGMKVLSTDNHQYGNVQLVGDILTDKVLRAIVRFKPDVIWASSPCTGFSIASVSTHWRKKDGLFIPKTSEAAIGMALALRVFEIVRAVRKAHGYTPVFFMENPQGMLRHMPFMDQAPIRHTVHYCGYLDTRIKSLIWDMEEKKCPSCGETKPVEEFYKNTARRDGFTCYCKECVKTANNKYNREHSKERLDYQQVWKANNREYVRKREAQYRKDKPELIAAKEKRYRERHPEKLQEKGRNYRRARPEYFLSKVQERRALEVSGGDGTVTAELLRILLDQQEGKCGYCRAELKEKHLDHIVPLTRGGLHTANNVHWTCPKCNQSKGNKLEEDWLRKPGMKPTDVFTNCKTWQPRPRCVKGSPCHEPAPRGSKSGTQGKANAHERAKLPKELCREVLKAARVRVRQKQKAYVGQSS